MKQRLRATFVAAITVCGLLFGSFVSVQPAQAASNITCSNSFGTKVPVLMVHGFDSNSGMWAGGNPSMTDALAAISQVSVVKPFDYKPTHLTWVTDSTIGPKLAATIDCLAQNSRQNGGAGKVIVIAHSMGGLATRYAANQIIDGRKVANELGLVVTLGTPHTGTLFGNAATAAGTAACQGIVRQLTFSPILGALVGPDQCLAFATAVPSLSKGSKQLQALPPFPRSVPVLAVAGDVSLTANLLFAHVSVPTNSDLAVGTLSATDEYADQNGGGRAIFSCEAFVLNPTSTDCWHNAMYMTPRIQQAVVDGIRTYLASLTRAAKGVPSTFYGSATLILPAAATVTGAGGEGASAYLVRCGDGSCPNFDVYRPNEVGGSDALGWRQWEISRCNDASGQITQQGTVLVGGKKAVFYTASICKPSALPSMAGFWDVDDGSLFVIALSLTPAQITQMNAILAAAVWR